MIEINVTTFTINSMISVFILYLADEKIVPHLLKILEDIWEKEPYGKGTVFIGIEAPYFYS